MTWPADSGADRAGYGGNRQASGARPYRDAAPYGDPGLDGEDPYGGLDPYAHPDARRDAGRYRDPYGGRNGYGDPDPYRGHDPYGYRGPHDGPAPYGARDPYGGPDPYLDGGPTAPSYPQPRVGREEGGPAGPATGSIPRRSAAGSDGTPVSGSLPAGRHMREGRRRKRYPVADAPPGGGDVGGSGTKKKSSPLAAALGAVTEVVVVVAMALALALIIKTFLVQAFFIPSASMEDTLLTGDRVLVSKLNPGPFSLQRGDIIVFKDPGGWLDPPGPIQEGPVRHAVREGLTFVGLLPQDSGEHLIKRIIGLPGDTVTCCDAEGRLQVNGVSIDEPYVYPGNDPSSKEFSVTLPAGQLWVMGDHRSVSEDSRFHPDVHDGTVPVTDVVGKAFVTVWPFDRATMLQVPPSVFARVPDSPATG